VLVNKPPHRTPQHRIPPDKLPRRQFEEETGGPSWIWGVHASLAALANPKRQIERVVATRNGAQRLPAGIEAHILDPDAIDGMLPPGAVHQGLAVRALPIEPISLEAACAPADTRSVLILDGVTDPQNGGAAFRSAAAFGARAVILQDRKSPALTGVLAKAAAGAIELVDHVRVTNISRAIAELRELGYLTLGLEGETDLAIADALKDPRPAALVLGAEGKGLREGVAEACEKRVRIPIASTMESLNVSVAAAIALYEAQRR
jgi:23S rRNA (guanosine2251-2'-O)-methyltransferase